MEHSFNIFIAERYGIPSAVLLKNIYFWIEKNRANEMNYYDGYFWTYNSKKAFADLFPYLTARQIDYALQKLIDDGLLITGNYNKVAYDRTLWYAITKKGYSILQNCEMDATKSGNGNTDIEQPIPYKNAVKTDDETADKKKGRKSKANSFDILIGDYAKGNAEIVDLLIEWLKVRKAKRAAMTDRAIELNLQKLDDLAAESGMTVADYLKEIICRGWIAFYPIKNYSAQAPKQSGGIMDDYNRMNEILQGDLF
jgi:hypothetical protein